MGSIIMHLLLVITAVTATVTAMPTWHDQEVERFLARLYASLDQPDYDRHDENGITLSPVFKQKIIQMILKERLQNEEQSDENLHSTEHPIEDLDTSDREQISRNIGGDNMARNLDSLGGGNIVRNLDHLGGGHIVRNLDSLGGGNIVRNLDSLGGSNIVRNLDSLGGGNIVRNLDSLGGGNIVRNLDSLGGGNIVRNLDSLGGGNIVRNLDSLGGGNIVRSIGPHGASTGGFYRMGGPRYIVRNIEQQNRDNNMVKYLKRIRAENFGTLDALGGPNLV